MDEIDGAIIRAAIAAAAAAGVDVADLPLDQVAQRAGISRATLFRRIGSRQALDAAVRATGVDPGGRPSIRDRAAEAAASIVRERGIEALTLEAVAAAAGCSIPGLHSQVGGREGVLAALFERYSPLPRVERLLTGAPPTLEAGVRAIHAAVFDAATAEPRLLQALLADALARPDGPARRFLIDRYLPRAAALLSAWLAGEIAAGRCRPLPLPYLLQLLAGPLALHVLMRGLGVGGSGVSLAGREEVIAELTAAYCRAVAPPPPGPGSPRDPASGASGTSTSERRELGDEGRVRSCGSRRLDGPRTASPSPSTRRRRRAVRSAEPPGPGAAPTAPD